MKRAEEFVYRAVEDGMFEIDSQGRIWRVARQQTNTWGYPTKIVPCKRKRAEKNKKGKYFQIAVMYEGVRGIALAHRLIWYHLHGSIPAHLSINHKDGSKKNNHPDNLELATRVEQAQHALKVCGWQPRWPIVHLRGKTNGMSKLSNAKVRLIRRSKKSGYKLAAALKVSPATISRVRNKKLWGYV